ncbi:MAG: DNA cytosine methyltransferase [Bacteroidales bacterium]|nr:DNA cytosine methyltransferase [Candidatus Colimorpha pelethequi]
MAKKKFKYDIPEEEVKLVVESQSRYGRLHTYVSLFSSAGVGCFGFKQEGFHCVATVELLERRLKIQKFNRKCILESGYICGDMTKQETKDNVFGQIEFWNDSFHIDDIDVVIATPPCQGMSVANHKKKDEMKRNSLVVESIRMVNEIKPRYFVFENVRAFLTTLCTDIDGQDKSIREAINNNLSGNYNILFNVVNFKDYGNPSSRTRTLVIGVRKDLKEITPYDLFPVKQPERTLRQVIGHLPALQTMGEIWNEDIYHNFRNYDPKMVAWIENIKEGQSAFDNTEPERLPHTIKDGVRIFNAQKNGDKYTRQYWDKVPPCIHTRNDIMASQNTVHPVDNRVFSIREVMLMMSVPNEFQWSEIPFDQLNALSLADKKAFLKKEEMNIRQNLGEAVPTVIFKQVAHNVRKIDTRKTLSETDIVNMINENNLTDQDSLLRFIQHTTSYGFAELSKIAELANAQRENNAAYYTRQDICYTIIKNLPELKELGQDVRILEPSVGVGNFLPTLIRKYENAKSVTIDVVDINPNSIAILRELLGKLTIPENIRVNYINDDFLLHDFTDSKYDVVIGNPPYMKITGDKELLAKYKKGMTNKETNNIFSFFIEKCICLGRFVSLIVPKSLINAPEFNLTRALMERYRMERIIDFGEKGFKGVKIETINFLLRTDKKPADTIVESYISETITTTVQSYITDRTYPYWLIYRNEAFDLVAEKMQFGIFRAYRDRAITKTVTKDAGSIRVLKSRNIGSNCIEDIEGYDCFMDDASSYDVSKYLNQPNCVLLPNLTYNPRACFLPRNCIADGSVAILTLIDENECVTEADLAYYATDEYRQFYAIARNKATRSMNIDNNSVFFFGKLKQK